MTGRRGIRRHFEELSPAHVTFGVAGFFGVAMDYRGLDDPCHVPALPGGRHARAPDRRSTRIPEHERLAQARARRRAQWAGFDRLAARVGRPRCHSPGS